MSGYLLESAPASTAVFSTACSQQRSQHSEQAWLHLDNVLMHASCCWEGVLESIHYLIAQAPASGGAVPRPAPLPGTLASVQGECEPGTESHLPPNCRRQLRRTAAAPLLTACALVVFYCCCGDLPISASSNYPAGCPYHGSGRNSVYASALLYSTA